MAATVVQTQKLTAPQKNELTEQASTPGTLGGADLEAVGNQGDSLALLIWAIGFFVMLCLAGFDWLGALLGRP